MKKLFPFYFIILFIMVFLFACFGGHAQDGCPTPFKNCNADSYSELLSNDQSSFIQHGDDRYNTVLIKPFLESESDAYCSNGNKNEGVKILASPSYLPTKTKHSLQGKIVFFKVLQLQMSNRIEWKAECKNDVDFTLQRSEDGINFKSIALFMAFQQDCSSPFKFQDKNPPSKAYYRLRLIEANGSLKYSNIISLDRKTETLL